MKIYTLLTGLLFMASIGFGQKIKIKGVVNNTKDSLIVFRHNDLNPITRVRDATRHKAPIDPNGKFEIELPEKAISEWAIELDGKTDFAYFCTNHHLNLIVDFSRTAEKIIAVGENSAEINFRNHLKKQSAEKYGRDFYAKAYAAEPLESLKLRKEEASFRLATLADYRKENPMSEAYCNWLKTLYKYEPYERVLLDNFIMKNIKPDSAGMALLVESGLDDDYAAKNSREYNDLIWYYMAFKLNSKSNERELFDFGTGNLLKGITREVFLIQRLMNIARDEPAAIYEEYHNKALKEIKDSELRAVIQEKRNEYFAKLSESNNLRENVSHSASLNQIFQKYKGKLIYVDFWASWCNPCRFEMSNSRILSAKLKGKDVVFLYFGYQDKKENWLAARKELEIEGEHYLLSPQLVKEANELFSLGGGIPHYAIIGKDGTIIDKDAPRPGEVYERLVKLLTP